MPCYGSDSCFPQLKFCCCGCTLRTGVLIMGWISAICGVLFVLLGWIFVAALLEIDTTNNFSAKIAILLWVMDYFINGILQTICAFYLLHGVYTNNPKKVLPFLIVCIASLIKLAIEIPLFTFTDIGTSVLIRFPNNATATPLFQPPLVLFFGLALNFYFLAVINSHYVEMKEQQLPR